MSQVLSPRQIPRPDKGSTCFFVLGLISTTRQGAELLEELGWIATRTATGKTTGICLPNDVSRFVRVGRGWPQAGDIS